MHIIGCDFHTRFQQIAMMDCQTGEILERRLDHETGEARKFDAALRSPARIGMEATGRAQWFERMLAEQGHELWVGDAAQIRAGVVRKQTTDARDACHILKMLLENRVPRIGIPSPGERDLRQRLQHRVRLVRFRTSGMNQLQALAMGHGRCRRKKLWTATGRNELEGLTFGHGANRRKQELLEILEHFQGRCSASAKVGTGLEAGPLQGRSPGPERHLYVVPPQRMPALTGGLYSNLKNALAGC